MSQQYNNYAHSILYVVLMHFSEFNKVFEQRLLSKQVQFSCHNKQQDHKDKPNSPSVNEVLHINEWNHSTQTLLHIISALNGKDGLFVSS